MADANGKSFQDLSGEMYRAWEQGMSAWWDQVLDSESFLKALGENLSAQTRARGQYEEAVDKSLQQWHLPTRSDVLRLAKIASMLEDRLLQQEDVLLAVKDRLEATEREVIQARIEAAEARLEMREKLAELQARLAAAEGEAAPGTTRKPARKA